MHNPKCERRDVCRLTAHIRGVAYGVKMIPIPPEATGVARAWRLHPDGEDANEWPGWTDTAAFTSRR